MSKEKDKNKKPHSAFVLVTDVDRSIGIFYLHEPIVGLLAIPMDSDITCLTFKAYTSSTEPLHKSASCYHTYPNYTLIKIL